MTCTSPKEKVKALLVHICSKVPEYCSGRIKLNKILWFCETETIYQTGQPLTGQIYIRQQFGPVALNAPVMRDELIAEKKINESTSIVDGKQVYRYRALEPVDLSKYFSPRQLEIIESQIEKFKTGDPMDLSDISHDSIWAALEDADEMPLDAYLLKPIYSEQQKLAVSDYAKQISIEEYSGGYPKG